MTESKLLIEGKQVVVPGQILANGMDFLPGFGTYRLEENIRAQQLGVLTVDGKVLRIIPLAGRYLPKNNDVIIGKVIDILMSGWRIDINSPYSAVLPLKDASFDYIRKGEDLTNYFDLEDYVVAKITQVTTQNLVDVSARGPGLRKLVGGRIVHVNTHKVPRVIGKRGSMVSMIKSATGCQITVGQNGLIWLKGDPKNEVIALQAIQKIEEQAHISGLTEKIKEFLEKATGNKVELRQEEDQEDGHDEDQENNSQDQGSKDNRDNDSNRRSNNNRRHSRGPRKGPRRSRN